MCSFHTFHSRSLWNIGPKIDVCGGSNYLSMLNDSLSGTHGARAIVGEVHNKLRYFKPLSYATSDPCHHHLSYSTNHDGYQIRDCKHHF